MGQKVHPKGFRLGVINSWDSRWYADRNYTQLLHEDIKLRDYLKKKLFNAGIAKIEIERAANKAKVTIHTARPGIVIGKKGAGIDQLRDELQRFASTNIFLNVVEVRKPEANAQLVAESIASQLERRVAFRRAMKKAMTSAFKSGVRGIKVGVSGRLGGADMSRREWYSEQSVPLHTLRADVEYGFAEAQTTYGKIGVKAWIYKGEILRKAPVQLNKI